MYCLLTNGFAVVNCVLHKKGVPKIETPQIANNWLVG
jgi:hypothetical protein